MTSPQPWSQVRVVGGFRHRGRRGTVVRLRPRRRGVLVRVEGRRRVRFVWLPSSVLELVQP